MTHTGSLIHGGKMSKICKLTCFFSTIAPKYSHKILHINASCYTEAPFTLCTYTRHNVILRNTLPLISLTPVKLASVLRLSIWLWRDPHLPPQALPMSVLIVANSVVRESCSVFNSCSESPISWSMGIASCASEKKNDNYKLSPLMFCMQSLSVIWTVGQVILKLSCALLKV